MAAFRKAARCWGAYPLGEPLLAKPEALAVVGEHFQGRGSPVAKREHGSAEEIFTQCSFAELH